MISMIKKKLTSNLRNKLIFSMVSVVSAILIFISILIYFWLSNNAHREYLNTSSKMLNMLSIRVEDYMDQIEGTSFLLQSDLFFYPEYYADSNDYRGYNYIIKRLQNVFLQDDAIHSILLYMPADQEVYVINKKHSLSFGSAEKLEDFDWYKKTIDSPQNVYWEARHQLKGYEEQYELNSEQPVFSVSRTITLNRKIYGVFLINYEADVLDEMLDTSLVYPDSKIELYNAEGEIYSSTGNHDFTLNREEFQQFSRSDDESMLSCPYRDSETGQKMTALFQKLEEGNVLVQMIPEEAINRQAKENRDFIIFLCFLTNIIITIFIILISSSVTKPLMRLKERIQAFGMGKTDVKLEVKSSNEVSEIITAFNNMTDQIDTLINERYRLNMENKRVQFKQLVAQINPHFLYNTLESIGSVAHEKGVEEVEIQLQKLAEILRYTIRSASAPVTLRNEIDNTNKYLDIQKFRFEERLYFSISVQDDLYAIQIPKLIIQPLVENAIVYGLEKSKHRLELHLTVFSQDNYCVIEISDNGGGMSQDTLQKYQDVFSKKKVLNVEDTSIGLYNIFNRLVLYYDQQFFIEIFNNIWGGLTVKIGISMQESLKFDTTG